jgi:hypothetical protein
MVVFEILLHYLQSQDWKEAFLKVIPARKQVTALEQPQEEELSHEETMWKEGSDGDSFSKRIELNHIISLAVYEDHGYLLVMTQFHQMISNLAQVIAIVETTV